VSNQAPPTARNRRNEAWLKLGLGLLLLIWLFAKTDVRMVLNVVVQTDIKWLPAFLLFAVVVYWFQGFILGIASRPFSRIPQRVLFEFPLLARFFATFIPSLGADLVSGLYLKPYFRNIEAGYSCLALIRMLNALSTLLIAIPLGAIYLPVQHRSLMVSTFGLLLVACTGAVFFLRQGSLTLLKLSKFVPSKLAPIASRFAAPARTFQRRPGIVAAVFALTALNTFLNALSYMFIAFILNITLSPVQALLASSATMLSMILPLTPGGIGVSETAFVIVGSMLGVPVEHAVAVAVAARLLAIICATPGGLLYVSTPLKAVLSNQ